MAVKFLKGVDLNGQRAVNGADGSAATDLVTKQQLDAAIRGLSWKQAVRVATTGNLNLASPGASIDGVTMASGDRFLAKDQSTGSQNGVYVWNGAASAATRATDADSDSEIDSMAVYVEQGTVNADRMYTLTTDNPTVGTTSLTFAQLGGGGTAYTAGNGLTLSGNDFNVGAGTGITVAADTVSVDSNVVTRKFAANCAATTNPQNFAHGLGTADVQVTIKEGNNVVYPDVSVDATNVIVDWGGAPTAGQYRVIAQG